MEVRPSEGGLAVEITGGSGFQILRIAFVEERIGDPNECTYRESVHELD